MIIINENEESSVPKAFDSMAVHYGSRYDKCHIKPNIGKLEFIIDSDIVLVEDSQCDVPEFHYVDLPRGLEKKYILDLQEIIEVSKTGETVRELQLKYNKDSSITPADLSDIFEVFLDKNKVHINEVLAEDLINPDYLNHFTSFNMTCYKSIIGMVTEIRKELDEVTPLAEQLIEHFDNERDKLIDSFIKEHSGYVMEHFASYEAMMARKRDKVVYLLHKNSKYSKLLNDLSSRRDLSIRNLISYRIKNLIQSISSYNTYMYMLPLGRIVQIKNLVMFSLDEVWEAIVNKES